MTTRRSLIKAAAWAAPTALVSVTAPAIASSTLRKALKFTNTTATVGSAPNVIYTNLKVQTGQGESVPGLLVTVAIGEDRRSTEHVLAPWGATDIIKHEFDNMAKGMQIKVIFYASAPGVEPIESIVYVTPPSWWG